jgi:hypothetical protein
LQRGDLGHGYDIKEKKKRILLWVIIVQVAAGLKADTSKPMASSEVTSSGSTCGSHLPAARGWGTDLYWATYSNVCGVNGSGEWCDGYDAVFFGIRPAAAKLLQMWSVFGMATGSGTSAF